MSVAEGAQRDSKKRGGAREQDNSEPRRPKNRPAEGRRHFRRSGEQLSVAEGAQRDSKKRGGAREQADKTRSKGEWRTAQRGISQVRISSAQARRRPGP